MFKDDFTPLLPIASIPEALAVGLAEQYRHLDAADAIAFWQRLVHEFERVGAHAELRPLEAFTVQMQKACLPPDRQPIELGAWGGALVPPELTPLQRHIRNSGK